MRPPAGYDDLIADAQAVPMTGDYDDLDVPGVGIVRARRPTPRSAAALAQAANGKLKDIERQGYLSMFFTDHLDEDEPDRLFVGMVMGDLPADSMQLVVQAVATWGTARPYSAVINLAVICGHHWRTLRGNLSTNGVTDPLTAFRSLHALLDYAEKTTMESLAHSGEGPDAHKHAQREMDSFMFKLYAPPPGSKRADEPMPVPAGFDPEDVEDSFDAFTKMLGG